MSDAAPAWTTRKVASLHEDTPESQANKVCEDVRNAMKVAATISAGANEDLIRSAAGGAGIMEHAPPVRTQRPSAPPQHAPAPAPVAPVPRPAAPQALIYGDGNVVEAGDIVLNEKTQMLAEVRTVAGNGVVLEVPAVGVQVIQPSALLGYKRMGNKGSAKS